VQRNRRSTPKRTRPRNGYPTQLVPSLALYVGDEVCPSVWDKSPFDVAWFATHPTRTGFRQACLPGSGLCPQPACLAQSHRRATAASRGSGRRIRGRCRTRVLYELRQIGSGGGIGPCDEGRGMLLHKAVQGGQFGALALAVDRGGIGRQVSLLHQGLHELLVSRLSCFTVSNRPAPTSGCRCCVGCLVATASCVLQIRAPEPDGREHPEMAGTRCA
jgi:hypothetical protein